jgi:hypothetical protein
MPVTFSVLSLMRLRLLLWPEAKLDHARTKFKAKFDWLPTVNFPKGADMAQKTNALGEA